MTAKEIENAEKLYDPTKTVKDGKYAMAAMVSKEEDGSYTVYPGEGRIRGYNRKAVDKFISDHGYVHEDVPVKEEETENER